MKRALPFVLIALFHGYSLSTALAEDTLPALPDPSLLHEGRANAPYKEIRSSALDALNQRDYPRLAALIAQYKNQGGVSPFYDGLPALGYFSSELSDPTYQTEVGYNNRLSQLTTWTMNAPDSIDAKCILADFWKNYAWFARGSGYANTVTQDGWKLFGERLDKARQILEDIRDKRQQTPFWFSAMQTVALGQNWNNNDYQALVQDAITTYPDYFTLYSKACIYYLPRWHGDNKTVHDFLLDAADRKGGDDGDVLLARGAIALWYYSHDIDPTNDIGLPWPRVSHGMQIICQRYPNSYSALNVYALLAWQANDRPTTAFLIQRINNHVYLGVWGNMENYNQAKAVITISEKPTGLWGWLEDYIKTIWP